MKLKLYKQAHNRFLRIKYTSHTQIFPRLTYDIHKELQIQQSPSDLQTLGVKPAIKYNNYKIKSENVTASYTQIIFIKSTFLYLNTQYSF